MEDQVNPTEVYCPVPPKQYELFSSPFVLINWPYSIQKSHVWSGPDTNKCLNDITLKTPEDI